MTSAAASSSERKQRTNRRIALVCVAAFTGMVGMSFAAVPLYRIFCQVTGYGGTTQRAAQAYGKVVDRSIKIRFDANVSGIPWDFRPAQREVSVKLGETTQVSYVAHNLAGRTTRGRATFNVTPEYAGVYFNKIECFCFSDQSLKAGETVDMPVVFYVDPDILEAAEAKGLTTITLSYTMFQHEGDPPQAALPAAGDATGNSDTKLGG
jgi:cytochrome c oxidase assembly protein subunit 11